MPKENMLLMTNAVEYLNLIRKAVRKPLALIVGK